MRRFVIFVLIVLSTQICADEGMWMPQLLRETCYNDMVEQGLLLPAESLYNEDSVSLKDAVVLFGGGATGVIVSDKGLVFTNHHCGYRYIQNHSSVDKNLLADGFWAQNLDQELPNPGLTVRIPVKIEDVTDMILSEVTLNMSEPQRKKIINENTQKIIEKFSTDIKDKNYHYTVKLFYNGNRFFICGYKIFQDVRLVGAPPLSIGKFGGDTDNWTWPRHTGDFAIFRIYVNEDNQPAPYSLDNIPYRPAKSVSISIRDTENDDFSFVMGFPSLSSHFITSFGLELLINQAHKQRISLSGECLKIWENHMKNDPLINIQYATKYASLSNGWKKWQGAFVGINQTNCISKLRVDEEIRKNLINYPETKEQYMRLLSEFEDYYRKIAKYETAFEHYRRGIMGVEILEQAEFIKQLLTKKPIIDVEEFLNKQKEFYKDYNAKVDKDVFATLVASYFHNVDSLFHPEIFTKYKKNNDFDVISLVNDIYLSSVLTSYEKLEKAMKDSLIRESIPETDPAIEIINSLSNNYNENLWPQISSLSEKIDSINRIYTGILCQILPEKKLYPDANQTLRISYGKKEGYLFEDTSYPKYTYFDGVFEKTTTRHPDYQIPEKLKDLHSKKDYGEYGVNGVLPVCFITSAHTSSGNSGSPVFNSRGELIGLNFDRNWQGTMSDIVYDPSTCRNIVVDSRYILFIIDKYAEAKNILNELVVVK